MAPPETAEEFHNDFALVGASGYLDAHPQVHEAEPRIYVKFHPVGVSTPYLGLLDTGAHYCILEPELADAMAGELTESIGQRSIHTARGLIRGNLYLHSIRFVAEVGDPLISPWAERLSYVGVGVESWRRPSYLV